MGSERRATKLSADARRVVERLLAGRSLDELAPRGTELRVEVEAHLLASLERAARTAARASSAPRAARPRLPAKGAVAWSDGASRGNPGPAAIGIVLVAADGAELWREGRRIGRATNNVAEYRGALAALEKARELGLAEVELRMDSELVVRQIEGSYRVREPALAALKREVDDLLAKFRSVRVRHVRREENGETDRLANEALDALDRAP